MGKESNTWGVNLGASAKSYAIRRSTRLLLEIPVVVSSLDPEIDFSEECRTSVINAHGCGVTVPRPLPPGTRVSLEIVRSGQQACARVAHVIPLESDSETWLLGIEMEKPGNFWGLEYPPSDWTLTAIGGSPGDAPRSSQAQAAAPAATRPPKQGATGDARPAPVSQCRLTDISVGACYLETQSPFPPGKQVRVSLTAGGTEFTLGGIVRVAHENSGMGIEFAPRTEAHRAHIQELIGKLAGQKEVPRVLVHEEENGKRPAEAIASSASPEDSWDGLLDLVRRKASLTAEQFREALKEQRLGVRRETRVKVVLPARLIVTDDHGQAAQHVVRASDISPRGVVLAGVPGNLGRGDIVSLEYGSKRGRFQVAWVGAAGTATAGQAGVTCLDTSSIW